jgi:pyrroline-5-carboxylate reductase
MGSSILQGIQRSMSQKSPGHEKDAIKVTKVLATTSSQASCDRLRSTFSDMGEKLSVSCGSNVEAMRQADVIILGCKPYMIQSLLQAEGVREAVKDKLIISVIAGKSVSSLRQYLQEGDVASSEDPLHSTTIVRTIPNVGAQVGASMTLVEEAVLPQHHADVVSWLFNQVGRVKYVPPSQFDVATSLMTASISVTSMLLDGMLDGAVAGGLKRSEALEIAAQGLQATAGILLADPACRPGNILERMSSPRGVTIQTILTAEQGNIRRVAAESVMQGTQHLQKMAQPS